MATTIQENTEAFNEPINISLFDCTLFITKIALYSF